MRLLAARGVYRHGMDRSHTTLQGNVRARFFGRNPLRVTTDRAVIVSSWDRAAGLRRQEMSTKSDVSVVGTERTLTGEGMSVFRQSREKEGQWADDKSIVTVKRNVVMVLRGGGSGLPAFADGEGGESHGEADTTRISCVGPLVFDRIANRACFHKHAKLARGGTTLQCDRLTMSFKAGKGGDDTRPELRELLAEDNVVLDAPDQSFRGQRFEWDPARQTGRLSGNPARMSGKGASASADLIRFDEKTQVIRYTGNPARVVVQLKGK
jgi:lipopolysaccharide export system protein LptA